MNSRHVVGVLVIVVVVVVEESATTAFPKFSLEEAFKYHASTAEKNDATVVIEGMVTGTAEATAGFCCKLKPP